MSDKRVASWDNIDSSGHTHCTCSPGDTLDSPQTLQSNCPLNDLNINGDVRTRVRPGRSGHTDCTCSPGDTLSSRTSTEGEEVETIKTILENSNETLSLLIAKVCQHIKKPIEDAEHPAQTRDLRELRTEFELKMKQLKRVVEVLSANETQNEFTDHELYSLIRHIKEDDWIHLMRNLKVSEPEMETCRRLYPNRREQKYQMLQIWLNNGAVKNHRNHLIYVLGIIEYDQLAAMFIQCSLSAPPLS